MAHKSTHTQPSTPIRPVLAEVALRVARDGRRLEATLIELARPRRIKPREPRH